MCVSDIIYVMYIICIFICSLHEIELSVAILCVLELE